MRPTCEPWWSAECDVVADFAVFAGVEIRWERFLPRMLDECPHVSFAPIQPGSAAAQGIVWWDPVFVETETPVWMQLLHEVTHAALGARGRVAAESYAAALDLWVCCNVWGVMSPQTRACIRWAIEADEAPSSSRVIWQHWQRGVLPFVGEPRPLEVA